MNEPVPSPVLGFDYGDRRIGIAVGQSFTGTAQPVAVVGNGEKGPEWTRIDALVREWSPQALVVGRPLTVDGDEQPITRRARAFGDSLVERYKLPVVPQDERYSSREASARFAEARKAGAKRKSDSALHDAIAAQVIVEDFFRERAHAA